MKKKCFHTETTVEWMQLIFSQKRAPFKEKPQNPFLPLFIRLISLQLRPALKSPGTTPADCFTCVNIPPENKAGQGGEAGGSARSHGPHGPSISPLQLQKYRFKTQGPAAESHMSGICMGEIALKWVTHDSFALRPRQLRRAKRLLDKYDSPQNRASLQSFFQCGISDISRKIKQY